MLFKGSEKQSRMGTALDCNQKTLIIIVFFLAKPQWLFESTILEKMN
jgi:hypothetical protein